VARTGGARSDADGDIQCQEVLAAFRFADDGIPHPKSTVNRSNDNLLPLWAVI
jgi:hypothetical protein